MFNFPFVEPTFGARKRQMAISQTIYEANAFNIRNWRDEFRNDPDMLPNSVINFLKLLAEREIDYCIVGGIAYLAYVEDRNTKDLDILISVKDLEKILPFVKVLDDDANFTRAEFESLQIDFLKTSNSLFDHIKRHETTLYPFGEGEYPIATIDGLVLMRFDAIIDLYKKGNFNKVLRYQNDLQFLTLNHEIEWDGIWITSERFFTKEQIHEFKKMVAEWQKPRQNPFDR